MSQSELFFSTPISAKLNPPDYDCIVERHNLLPRFPAALAARLVLVTAPVGFGKTIALLEYRHWLQKRRVATAWLSIDAEDDDPRTLLVHLTAAMAGIFSDLQDDSDPDSLEAKVAGNGLSHLIDQAWKHKKAFALLLTDFDAVSNHDSLGILRKLLENLPTHGQVALTVHEAPSIGIPRLKAKGLVEEIGAAELCFTEQEAIDYFDKMTDERIPHEDCRTLWRQLEGWPAGLQLAALSACGGEGGYQSIIGNRRGLQADIAAYLAEEVLLQLPANVQSFLLKTCVLDTLDPELCAALTGCEDPYEILRFLERKNLFLFPLDPQHSQYHGGIRFR